MIVAGIRVGSRHTWSPPWCLGDEVFHLVAASDARRLVDVGDGDRNQLGVDAAGAVRDLDLDLENIVAVGVVGFSKSGTAPLARETAAPVSRLDSIMNCRHRPRRQWYS